MVHAPERFSHWDAELCCAQMFLQGLSFALVPNTCRFVLLLTFFLMTV